MAFEVPTIDLSPFLAAIRELREPSEKLPAPARDVAIQWREAFACYGFANITGHGVPDKVIEDAYSKAKTFFELPAATKQKYDLGKGYGAGGFTSQGVERVSATASRPDGSALGSHTARPPDRVESMVAHKRPHDTMPDIEGYREAIYNYFDELTRLLKDIMSLTACALDLPLDYFFESYFDTVHLHGAVAKSSLRLAYYPAWEPGEGAEPGGSLRYGEHTDYTGFTILWQDHNSSGPQTATTCNPPPGGLEVKMPDGTWAQCPPVPRAFTVNAGDLIQVWSNDVLLSNLHRVANPPLGDSSSRISLVFFTGPKPDVVVEALPTCCGDRPQRYPPITAGEHLAKKLAASNR